MKLIRSFLTIAVTAVVAFGADNTIGTWKLNMTKSKFTPAPMPVKSLNVAREASDGGVKQTTTGQLADGTAINATFTAKYDGKEVQITGNAPYNTIAIKQVNANALTDVRKNTATPYRATARTVVSNGGKTMTVTAKGTNTDGKAFASTLIFDKQ